MSSWTDPYLTELFRSHTPLIDVRAPVEFEDGSLPGAANLPIMNNDERAQVGTCYKAQGQEEAIDLGHRLVSGEVREGRIRDWVRFIQAHPTAQVYCFRGGLRSQITCRWLKERGIERAPIAGGYKRMRTFFLSLLQDAPLPALIRIGGLTGSGKTRVLLKIPRHIDIEGHASHRGSAFGQNGKQPSQVTFENLLAADLLRDRALPVWVEDESVTLGKLTIPLRFFSSMREAPLAVLKVDLDTRIRNIFEDYIRPSTPEFFFSGIDKIERRLGKSKGQLLKDQITRAYQQPLEARHHAEWVTTLLTDYYDPFYQKALRNQRGKIVFEGTEAELLEFASSGLKG